MGFALSGGGLLSALYALVCPWLIGLEGRPATGARPILAAAGLAVGLIAAAGVQRGPLGGAGAMRLGVYLARGGYACAILAALATQHEIGAAPAIALAMCACGCSVLLAIVLALGAWYAARVRGVPASDPGTGLRTQLARACGGLAFGAWALSAGHVLGQRHTDSLRHAIDEARDVVGIVAERRLLTPASIDHLAPDLAPKGGWLVDVDEGGRVIGGVGVGVPAGEVVSVGDSVCRVAHRTLPCAWRRLIDNSRVVAAVPPRPASGGEVLAFLLVGLIVAAGALGVGALQGTGTSRDLERVARTLDELKKSAKGVQSSLDLRGQIVVASPDEVGELSEALGLLRAKLRPMIDEYRIALERSQAADEARDELLARVSVALRTPLNQAMAAADALLDMRNEPLSAEQRDDVKTVLSAGKHLIDLIDEVLDVSAIATGQVKLRLGDVDLGALVLDVAKSQRPIVQKKGVEVRVRNDTPSPVVRGDEARLRQVLTNIISNAVKFTERGSIDISVVQSAGVVEVRVKDTGPGIPPEALPKLFREFVQLGSLRQRAHGTGLGLAICKRLLEAHGGEVRAESVVGQGSTFIVTVPVAGPPAPSSPLDDTPVQGVEAAT
jgi:signal transduction histidine kinase